MKKLFIFLLLCLLPELLFAASLGNTKPLSNLPRSSSSHQSSILNPQSFPYTYGQTKICDDLWQIASFVSHKNPSVTVHQTMLAILNTNPKAFYKRNVNGLMIGYVLSIPSPKNIQKISQKSAYKIIKKQHRAWQKIMVELSQNPSAALLKLRRYPCAIPRNITLFATKTIPQKPNDRTVKPLKNTQMQQKITALKNQIASLIQSNQNQLSHITNLMLDNQALLTQNKQLSQNILQSQQQLTAAKQKLKQAPTIEHILHGFKLNTISSKALSASPDTQWLQHLSFLHKKNLDQFLHLHRKNMELWSIVVVMLAILALLIGIISLLHIRLSKKSKPQIPSEPTPPESKKTRYLNYKYIAGEDVVTAKLDLARAYVDMGDYKNAETILQDIIKDGSETQKIDAKNLLEKCLNLKSQ